MRAPHCGAVCVGLLKEIRKLKKGLSSLEI